jgi:hypothetical protein
MILGSAKEMQHKEKVAMSTVELHLQRLKNHRQK